jgi:hypothetical protein
MLATSERSGSGLLVGWVCMCWQVFECVSAEIKAGFKTILRIECQTPVEPRMQLEPFESSALGRLLALPKAGSL